MSNKRIKSAVDVCPEILKWWNYDKNKDIDLTTVTPGSSKKYYFHCPECDNEIYRSMYSLLKKHNNGTYSISPCQKCHPTQSKLKVNLVDAVKDIEKYWDYEANNGKKPSDFGASSSEKVWTKCPICGTSIKRNVRFSWEKDEQGIGHVIHCRTCGKRNKNNSLVKLFPEILKYWNYEKNAHDPDYYSISSGKKVYTYCPECGEERYISICDLIVNKDGKYKMTICQKCSSSKSNKQFKSISMQCPDIYKYWDDSNEYKPEKLLISASDIKISLHCPDCGKLLKRRVCDSFKKDKETGIYKVVSCHKCATKKAGLDRAMNQSKPLVEECPEFEEWWDYDKNAISIRTITRGSHYKAYLKCPSCKKIYYRTVHSFVSVNKDGKLLPVSCPSCGHNYKGIPENNILHLCPSIEEWWDYEANYPFCPEQFTRGSQFKAYFTCPDCGRRLYDEIHSFFATDENGNLYIKHEGKCRKYKAMKSENNLLKKFPQVKEWWDYDLNNGELPEEYTIYSRKKIHFVCPDCGAKTYRRIKDAFNFVNDNGTPILFECPYCNDKKVLPGYNSLMDIKPELAEEWSPNNEKNANEVLPNSYDRVLWMCPTCKGEYSALVRDREVGDDSCPYCKNKKLLPGYNSLVDIKPELAAEWSPNNQKRANEVLPDSTQQALWICPTCKGEYSASVRDREVGDDSCPYCKNKKLLPGYNSLKDINPQLVEEEWCYIENTLIGVKPDNILESFQGKVWWKCQTCGRKYLMSVKERLMKKKRGHIACHQCRGKRWIRTFNIK